MPPTKNLLDQLADKFTVGDGCWEWTACKGKNGYGQLRRNGKGLLAHRVLYELMVGPIPEGLDIDHLCRNPGCVRPDHLEAVTHQENGSRGLRGRLITHCPQGHPYSESNTYYAPSRPTHRCCRICLLHHHQARRTKLRAEGRPVT